MVPERRRMPILQRLYHNLVAQLLLSILFDFITKSPLQLASMQNNTFFFFNLYMSTSVLVAGSTAMVG